MIYYDILCEQKDKGMIGRGEGVAVEGEVLQKKGLGNGIGVSMCVLSAMRPVSSLRYYFHLSYSKSFSYSLHYTWYILKAPRSLLVTI